MLSQPPPSRGRHAAHPEPLPSASTPAELACARLAVDARGASGSSVNRVPLGSASSAVSSPRVLSHRRLDSRHWRDFTRLPRPERSSLTSATHTTREHVRTSLPNPAHRSVGRPSEQHLLAGGDSLPSRSLELNGRQLGFPRLGPNASALPGSIRSSKSDWLARGTSPQPLPPRHPSSLADARPGWRPRSSEPHRALGSTRLGRLPTLLREEPG